MKLSSISVLFVIALAFQAGLTWFAVDIVKYPISNFEDSWQYVGITDNVLAGHGFAIEREFPWRPDGTRTPGMLLINIPLRVLWRGQDLHAALASRLILALAALIVGIIAARTLRSSSGFLAGAALIVTPSISYYTITPFETELHYLLALSLLFLGTLIASSRRLVGLLLVATASGYALLLRPAAQFPLIATALVYLAWVRLTRKTWRNGTALGLCMAVIVGTSLAYVLWGARNYAVFGAFAFSTVPGNNLLHVNAAGMRPFLDDRAVREINEAIAAHPIQIPLYAPMPPHYGMNQFVYAAEQSRAGRALIQKHPLAFLVSHCVGSFRAFSIFEPKMLTTHFGMLPAYVISSAQMIFTVGGFLGIARLWKNCEPEHRLVVAAMLAAGIVSVISAGVLASPRFRLPLEIPLATGWAALVEGRIRASSP